MDYMIFNGEQYEVVDTLEYVTLADSFVKNKIGTGHGEAKLYVGNESERLLSFFEKINDSKCCFKKSDFIEYLSDAKSEFLDPQQEYVKKDDMPELYKQLDFAVQQFSDEPLFFESYRVGVEPPRVYINSKSNSYDFMRSLGLPNISYLSVLKLKNSENAILYYFKMFVDYKSDLVSYVFKEEEQQEERINNASNLSDRVKSSLINSRIGQGDYRKKLMDECPFCPFTMVSDERLLVASHIKPWVLSDDKEKVDPKNGFLFTPTFDRLFDRGFISFEDDKTLMVSPWISPMNQKRLGIYNGKIIDALPLDDKRKAYLAFHREYIFKY